MLIRIPAILCIPHRSRSRILLGLCIAIMFLFVQKAWSDENAPIPRIFLNRMHGAVSLPAGESIEIRVGLSLKNATPLFHDWWLVANTSFGMYSYTGIGWVPDLQPEAQAALTSFDPIVVQTLTGLPVGNYTFYFGVDAEADGVPTTTSLSYDAVSLQVKNPSESAGAIDPIYVSVVVHYEEDTRYHEEREKYLRARSSLILLAATLQKAGISLNVQPDWTFLRGIQNFDTEGSVLLETTNNKNLLRWLAEDCNAGIDPHAHENLGYNYADVAYLIEALGVTPSPIVGGLVVAPVESSEYDRFLSPRVGEQYEYTWTPAILWGDATAGHVNDTAAGGVWKPMDISHYYYHDDTAPLVAIGKGDNSLEGLYALVDSVRAGELPPGKIRTCTIFIGQGEVRSMIEKFDQELTTLQALETEGLIVFAPLMQVYRLWQNRYKSDPHIYLVEG